MKTTNDSIDFLNTRQGLRIAKNVDDPCMATASHHDQPFVLHMDDGTLIIMDQRIRLPPLFTSRIMDREASLKGGGAGDFTGDEDHSLYQHRGTHLLNDLDMFAQQV